MRHKMANFGQICTVALPTPEVGRARNFQQDNGRIFRGQNKNLGKFGHTAGYTQFCMDIGKFCIAVVHNMLNEDSKLSMQPSPQATSTFSQTTMAVLCIQVLQEGMSGHNVHSNAVTCMSGQLVNMHGY